MNIHTDIAVIGGGQAGVCAAIAVAQEGKKVVLVQDRPILGGNASSEAGVPSHGAEAMAHNRNCRDTGLLEEMRLDYYINRSPHADSRSNWDVILMEKCLAEKNLQLLLSTKVIDCTVADGKITEVSAYSMQKEEPVVICAKMFIDATGDGFLAAKAGAEFRLGRESAAEFGEKIFGREVADGKTLGSTVYGWAVKRDYPVPYTPPEWAIRYNSCDALKHRPHTMDHLFPTVTSSEDHNTLQIFWWLEWGGQLDVIKDSDTIYRRLLAELFGVWDHLKNSCTVETRKALENFELNRWTSFPLKRESRRIMGDYIITENDLFNATPFSDGIGFGGWPLDDHPPEGIASQDPACDQVFVSEPYSVPLRSVYSKDIANLLLAGRCLSATHSALSSIRVMNTLGAIGEAVGTAAAVCVETNSSPREVYQKHMHHLQQRIVQRDLYVIGVKDSAQANLALQAQVETSSSLSFSGTNDSLGAIELLYTTALQFPASSPHIHTFAVCLESEVDTTVTWKLYRGNRIGVLPEDPVREGKSAISAGTAWYELISAPLEAAYGDIWSIVLLPAKTVKWLYGSEIFQTRWGIDFTGEKGSAEYHGRARMAPKADDWIWVNHHGRLPATVQNWLSPKQGKKIHDKLFATPAFRISPSQSPYDGSNLVNGMNRPESWPNIWISAPGLPQWAALRWEHPVIIDRIELYFDTQLDYSDQKYGFPRGKDDYSLPHKVEETVKAYHVDVMLDGNVMATVQKGKNVQRRCVHQLDRPVLADQLVLHVTETWGDACARVYGVRASLK